MALLASKWADSKKTRRCILLHKTTNEGFLFILVKLYSHIKAFIVNSIKTLSFISDENHELCSWNNKYQIYIKFLMIKFQK